MRFISLKLKVTSWVGCFSNIDNIPQESFRVNGQTDGHPSVHDQLVKMLIFLEPHNILHTYACQHFLTTGMRNHLFMDEGLLSISLACCGQLVKMLITLEPNGIFEANFL